MSVAREGKEVSLFRVTSHPCEVSAEHGRGRTHDQGTKEQTRHFRKMKGAGKEALCAPDPGNDKNQLLQTFNSFITASPCVSLADIIAVKKPIRKTPVDESIEQSDLVIDIAEGSKQQTDVHAQCTVKYSRDSDSCVITNITSDSKSETEERVPPETAMCAFGDYTTASFVHLNPSEQNPEQVPAEFELAAVCSGQSEDNVAEMLVTMNKMKEAAAAQDSKCDEVVNPVQYTTGCEPQRGKTPDIKRLQSVLVSRNIPTNKIYSLFYFILLSFNPYAAELLYISISH